MFFQDTHVGNYGAVALDDVRAVMTLQHHIQVHQNPLVLIFVSCTTHLLVTYTQKKDVSVFECIEINTIVDVHVKKQVIRKSQNKDSSGELSDCLIVKQLGLLQLSHLLNRRLLCGVITANVLVN